MTDIASVHDFWNSASCGENLYLHGSTEIEAFEHQARERYRLEPGIPTLARFDTVAGRQVLEIGVGLGADHERFVRAGAKLKGVDLTERAVDFTRRRLALYGLDADVDVANAEALPFADNSFDIVYSWGVLHHSPNTKQAFREVLRVLRPGGEARLMIYNKYSVVGYMLGELAADQFCPLGQVDHDIDRYIANRAFDDHVDLDVRTGGDRGRSLGAKMQGGVMRSVRRRVGSIHHAGGGRAGARCSADRTGCRVGCPLAGRNGLPTATATQRQRSERE